MTVEVMKDLLKIDQVIGEGDTQALVEGEILVPDVKPDISRILSVDGEINITDKEPIQDKINVEGVVNFKILYAAQTGEYPIYSMDASANFSQSIDIKDTLADMDIHVDADIEHIDFDMINERKIGIKTVVNLCGKSKDMARMDVLKGVEGLSDLQLLKNTVEYNNEIGSNTSETMIKENFELDENMPEIAEILKCDAIAVEKEKQVTDGKVIVSGMIKTNALYIADDEHNSLCVSKQEIPFTHFVEVAGAMKDMDCNVNISVDEVYTDVKENVDGDQKILELEAVVNVGAKVHDIEQKEVVVDAYSPSQSLKLDRKAVSFKQMIGHNASNVIVKEMVDIPNGELPIFKVFSVHAKPVITDVNLVKDKSIVEGVVEADLLYLSQNKEESAYSIHQEIPFRHFVDVDGARENMDVHTKLRVEDIDYTLINPEQVELKVNIKATCQVDTESNVDVLIGVEEDEEVVDLKKLPSMTIYYIQPGDSLWKIAKRYHTTVDNLIETNHIENPNRMIEGDQIIIQKTFEYKI